MFNEKKISVVSIFVSRIIDNSIQVGLNIIFLNLNLKFVLLRYQNRPQIKLDFLNTYRNENTHK